MKKYSSFFLLIFMTSIAWSQTPLSTKSKKAIKRYMESDRAIAMMDFVSAIKPLTEAIEADSNFVEAHQRLGDIYRELHNNNAAKAEFLKVLKINPDLTKNTYYSLGEIEFENGKYTESKTYFQKYLSYENKNGGRKATAARFISNCDFASSAINNPVPYNPINLGKNINSPESEYLPCVTADDKMIIFTRRDVYGEDFYVGKKKDSVWQPAIPLSKNINTPGNEGAQCISPDGQYLFFTGCNRDDGLGDCDIYYTKRVSNDWSKPVNIGAPINTQYWESQPSLSSDGKTLYFTSTRPGGYGKSDIWYSTYNGKGLWSEPKNLGKNINTAEQDISPYIHVDNQTLYFCSEGLPGMGRLDNFFSKRQPDGTWGTAVNLGYPVNTHRDESSLVVSADGKKGYFASTYLKGEGQYDLYMFEIPEKDRPIPTTYVQGVVFDKLTLAKLSAQIEVIELESNSTLSKTNSNASNGEFLVCLPSGKDYLLNVSKDGYLFYSDHFSLKNVPTLKPFQLSIPLNKIEIGEKMLLKNIFFETASAQLKPESKSELDKALSFLQQNQSLKIEIGGHTDDIGDEKSNMALSANRAKAVYDYFIANNISLERLSYKGYGESMPIDNNQTEEGRANNRRTEMKIISK